MIAERILNRRMLCIVGLCVLTLCLHSIEGRSAEAVIDADAVRARQAVVTREAMQHLQSGKTDAALVSLAPIAISATVDFDLQRRATVAHPRWSESSHRHSQFRRTV